MLNDETNLALLTPNMSPVSLTINFQPFLQCHLTHWGPVSHYDLSSVRSSGIHMGAILQEIPQSSVTEISLKIIYITGANELKLSQREGRALFRYKDCFS